MNHCEDPDSCETIYWDVKAGMPIYAGDAGAIVGYLGEDVRIKVEDAPGDTKNPYRDPERNLETIKANNNAKISAIFGPDGSNEVNVAQDPEWDQPTSDSGVNANEAPAKYETEYEEASNYMRNRFGNETHRVHVAPADTPEDSKAWREYAGMATDLNMVDPNVVHPSHYVEGRKYEPKDVIRDWGLNFNLGSAVKYLSRSGRKENTLEDLQKARQFIDFEIDALHEEGETDD